MDSGGDKAAENARREFEKQQRYQQQQLYIQQLQQPIPRFAFDIGAHNLRPQYQFHHHRPLNPSSSSAAPSRIASTTPPPPPPPSRRIPNQNPNLNPPVVPINNIFPQKNKVSVQLAYEDAKRICHPDFKRPFSSIEDACERLLPYHVAAANEEDEDDETFDPANSSDQTPSRAQLWDNSIAAKVAEFTTTFEKQVLAYNVIQNKRRSGQFRTEEHLLLERLLLEDEKRALMETKAAMEARRTAQEGANKQMAAMIHPASQAHNEMMVQASGLGYGGGGSIGPNMGEKEQVFQQGGSINAWGGTNTRKDDGKEVSTEFSFNEYGGTGGQYGWPGTGQLEN